MSRSLSVQVAELRARVADLDQRLERRNPSYDYRYIRRLDRRRRRERKEHVLATKPDCPISRALRLAREDVRRGRTRTAEEYRQLISQGGEE